MQVTLDGGTIKITEQGLRDVLAAVDKAKEQLAFTTEPMPDGDMSMLQFTREKMLRGLIPVTSPCSQFKFQVMVNVRNDESESMGWNIPELLDKS
jgi:hypothetical protein